MLKEERKLFDYSKAAEYIKTKIPADYGNIGIILGSGLGGITDELENPICIPYIDIPGFPALTAPGHKGALYSGSINGRAVIILSGRYHYYEGFNIEQITAPVRLLKKLAIKTLIITNAAGGINTDYKPGDFMIIKDHINFLPNPLIGKNNEEFGGRFPDMTFTYDKTLRELTAETAKNQGSTVHEGIYIGVTGPSYETPAEIRAFRILGADAVGMSTIPEVITAAHCGIKILAISLITNYAAGILLQPLTLEEVINTGEASSKNLRKLIKSIVNKIERE